MNFKYWVKLEIWDTCYKPCSLYSWTHIKVCVYHINTTKKLQTICKHILHLVVRCSFDFVVKSNVPNSISRQGFSHVATPGMPLTCHCPKQDARLSLPQASCSPVITPGKLLSDFNCHCPKQAFHLSLPKEQERHLRGAGGPSPPKEKEKKKRKKRKKRKKKERKKEGNYE